MPGRPAIGIGLPGARRGSLTHRRARRIAATGGRAPLVRRVTVALAVASLVGMAPAVTEDPDVLVPGRPLRDLGGAAGSETIVRIDVAAGTRRLRISTRGGAGDADVYVRRGAHASPTASDYSNERAGNRVVVSVKSPAPGPWYVLLRGYEAFRGVRLSASVDLPRSVRAAPRATPGPGVFPGRATVALWPGRGGGTVRYTTDGTEPTRDSPAARSPVVIAASARLRARTFLPGGRVSLESAGEYEVAPAEAVTVLQSGVAALRRCGDAGSVTLFRLPVPGSGRGLRVSSRGGSGDTSVAVRLGAPPLGIEADATADGPRNLAGIAITDAAAGDWYVALRGETAFAGVQVVATIVDPLPDLIVDAARLGPYVSDESFGPESCEVVEGLVEPGPRRLLRFTTATANVGGSDLVLGEASPGNPLFEFHACHGHYHFHGFAAYRLLTSAGDIAAAGTKVSFCLEDVVLWDPDASSSPRYDCEFQGIQSGWADVYDSGLPGQWVDVTGVPAGDYRLEVTVNPDAILGESDLTNNTVGVPVRIE